VLPGKTYLVTRRCSQRQFLLRPSKQTDEIFGYVLAVATARYGVQLHVATVMSNHYHLVLTDPRAQLPAFSQYLDALIAKAMNAAYERCENFWAPGSFSAVVLEGEEDVVEKCVYTLANPVQAGLVSKGRTWPGLWSDPERIGERWRTFERPGAFFASDGTMPERATLRLDAPPNVDAAAFRRAVVARLEDREREIERAMAAEGRSFLGRRRVRAQRHVDTPATVEPGRGLKPRVAARDRWKRVEALGRLRSFLDDYREALSRWRAGVAGVVFPAGTYGLRVLCAVPCAAG
jgi:REP element-mobilizing transposase RayT